MAEAPVAFKDVVPEEYRNAGYLKDMLDKPWDEARPLLFKKLAGAQELIGKKSVGLPAADASEEDWGKFLDGLKPASAEEYKIPTKEGAKVDPVFIKALQQSFLDGRVNPRQAQAFMGRFSKEMEAYSAAQTKAAADKQAKLDADFDTLAKAALGDGNKAQMARAKVELEKHTPASLKPYIAGLGDKELVVLTGVINGILKEYASEDDLNPQGKTGGDGSKSKRAEAAALNAEVMKMKGFEPDYAEKREKLRQLYKEAAAEAENK